MSTTKDNEQHTTEGQPQPANPPANEKAPLPGPGQGIPPFPGDGDTGSGTGTTGQ